jgi:putative hydrolase of the HAD superfamily
MRRPTVEILALDVDGVLLDPERHGAGNWSNELEARFGLTRPQLRETFFTRSWDDVINGRRPIESALAEALQSIDNDASVDDVLECWFDADFAVVDRAVELARHATDLGVKVVLATNQEHRRAAYLRRRLGAQVELSDVIYSADLGCQKHDPAFFELASDRLNVARERRSSVLFIDDVARNVDVARAAGWQAMYAPPGADWIPDAEALLGVVG